VLANAGVTHDTAGETLAIADGIIVGTALKIDGSTWNAIDPVRAARMVQIVLRREADEATRWPSDPGSTS
jgi:uncharacterized protein